MSEAAVVAVALASALAAAASTVLQHRAARRAPDRPTHRLLAHLVTRPAWLGGLVAAETGLVLKVVALAHGQLTVVQPVLISGVLFALPVSALLEGRRPSAWEGLLALALVAGLAAFLLAGRPGEGAVPDASVLGWSTAGGMGVVGSLALLGLRWSGAYAPALLGTASGVGYGIAAALLKATTDAFRGHGLGGLVTYWALYALLGVGATSLALSQKAYQAGPLARSLPALTVSDPIASVLFGILVFHEHVSAGRPAVTGQVVGFLTMALAAAHLARRGAVTGRTESAEHSTDATIRRPRAGGVVGKGAGSSGSLRPWP